MCDVCATYAWRMCGAGQYLTQAQLDAMVAPSKESFAVVRNWLNEFQRTHAITTGFEVCNHERERERERENIHP